MVVSSINFHGDYIRKTSQQYIFKLKAKVHKCLKTVFHRVARRRFMMPIYKFIQRLTAKSSSKELYADKNLPVFIFIRHFFPCCSLPFFTIFVYLFLQFSNPFSTHARLRARCICLRYFLIMHYSLCHTCMPPPHYLHQPLAVS